MARMQLTVEAEFVKDKPGFLVLIDKDGNPIATIDWDRILYQD